MIWYKKHPEILEDVKFQLKSNYPTLHVVIERNVVFIKGSLFIKNPSTGFEVDRFGIEIVLPDDYPNSIPRVYESEGRIPKVIDRHFMSDGSACLFFRDEQFKFYNRKTPIKDFIGTPVYNFFLSQAYFDLTGKWIFGERSHGPSATWEYYTEELGTNDLNTIGRFLCFLASDKVSLKQKCYCGSNKLLVHCHMTKVIQIRQKIPVQKAMLSLRDILYLRDVISKAIKSLVK